MHKHCSVPLPFILAGLSRPPPQCPTRCPITRLHRSTKAALFTPHVVFSSHLAPRLVLIIIIAPPCGTHAHCNRLPDSTPAIRALLHVAHWSGLASQRAGRWGLAGEQEIRAASAGRTQHLRGNAPPKPRVGAGQTQKLWSKSGAKKGRKRRNASRQLGYTRRVGGAGAAPGAAGTRTGKRES